jgi:predicted O-methyltransferase YrrM
MEFLPPDIDRYATAHSRAESDVLHQLARETWLKVLQPRMLSGHLQGRVLSLLSHLAKPRRILEVGTYTGYSAICLAEGLQAGGELHTIDINEELLPIAEKYFHLSGNGDRIHMHIGDAMHIIPTLPGPFDLVFIDADKCNYPAYYELLLPRMPKGALLIADNVLWSGKVLSPAERAADPDTEALHRFNELVTIDPRVENVLLPLRDGLMAVRKTTD